ncbi:MAG: hypothetical protein Q9165_008408 [Trypethelium subeluteriae]
MADNREKLRGDNVAYYCSAPSDQQLFEIEEFTIAPNPPILEHRFFGFLMGFMPHEPEADLNNSSLQLSMFLNDEEISRIDIGLDDEHIFKRHDSFEYGPKIKPGRMEFLMDYLWLPDDADPGVYKMKAESRLPDGRVLFCFDFSYEEKTSAVDP